MATVGPHSYLLGTCLLVGVIVVADGSAFLTPTPVLEQMRVEDMRAAMLDQLMSALGSGNRVTKDRLANLEEAIHPIFLSLPKNTEGNLDHDTVRYLLHRIFVLRHGMFIKGLHPGEEVNASSVTMVLDNRVPSYVQDLFEDRLQGRGFGLHDVSLLAATLEHLIKDENLNRLKFAYEVYGRSLDDQVPKSVADDLVGLYMVYFWNGKSVSAIKGIDVKAELSILRRDNAKMRANMQFASEVLTEVVDTGGSNPLHLPFSVVASAVEEIADRYGNWNNNDFCVDTKSAMLSVEKAGSGRVPLKYFHSLGRQFSESKSYLQKGGVLDESDPERPSVIIANYINAHTNCVPGPGMYSVCCVNECEGLLGHLEREVAQPEATPENILQIVANLPSATVQAPRVLSESLRSRLHEIAIHHGAGRVPLHGRLFTQWMHHAYPRECSFPHMPGKISTERVSESMNDRATAAEKLFYQDALSSPGADEALASEEITMWSTEEQLVAISRASPTSNSHRHWRTIAFIGALVSACVSLRRMVVPAFGEAGKKSALPFANKDHFC